jgi:hypothetical protein
MHTLIPNADDILTANLPLRNDPWYILCERAMEDKRYAKVRDQIAAGRKSRMEGMEILGMDGPFFHDTRMQSVITAPTTATVLAATDKIVTSPVGFLFALPQGYFYAGKKMRLTVWGTLTTAATPGNLGIESYVGSTDAGGTLMASSGAIPLVASQANMPFLMIFYLKCNGGAVETAKPCESYGWWQCPIAVVTAANQQAFNPIPIVTPAAVPVDNTLTTLGFNIQMKRSGSTAETFTTRDITLESLN